MNLEHEPWLGRAIFRQARDAFLLVHPAEGRILDANAAAHRLCARTPGSLVGLALSQLFDVEGAAALERACREGADLVWDTTLLASRLPVQVTVSSLQPEGVAFLVVRDVSERNRAARHSQSRRLILEQIATGKPLNAILESVIAFIEGESPDALGSILLLDRARRRLIRGVAPRLPEFYNRAIEQIEMGPNIGSCGAAVSTRQRCIAEDIETHPNWAAFLDLTRAAGLRSCWSEPILSSTGEVLGTFAIYHTRPQLPTPQEEEAIGLSSHLASIAIERTFAEETARASEQMLRMVLDNIPQGVFWKDRRSTYLGCNRVVARAFGLERPEDIVGQDDRQLTLTPEQADFFITKDRQVIESNAAVLGIVEPARLADGTTIWMETNKIPMRDATGEVVGILGTWQDITQRRLAEQERQEFEVRLRHTAKLESLGVLAGGIAHDFNNLLTGILGYADLAQREVVVGSLAHQLLREAINGVHRAAELTRQMLAYSGKGQFVLMLVHLPSVTEDMARLLLVSISKKCELRFHLVRNVPVIEADIAQLHQVIMNLIINASEAIGDQPGVINVSTGVMTCTRAYLSQSVFDEGLPEGRYVFLEVSDTGCGMTEPTRSRIFDPFFTTKFTGRGLGLSAVLGIVRGHRGAIRCASEPGLGTTFRVLFPVSSRLIPVLGPMEPDPTIWRGSGTVLVVDDESVLRDVARRMLGEMGFTVLTADDGQQALDRLRDTHVPIRLVLLDLTMPRLSGEEALREIRRVWANIPVILTSGYVESAISEQWATLGASAFLQKPYRFDDLQAIVRKIVERETDDSE